MSRFALIFVLLLSGTAAIAQIECRNTVTQGDPMLILIRAPEAVETMQIEMLNQEQISAAQAFPLRRTDIGWQYGALIGLPSTLKSGRYNIRAVGKSRDLTFKYSKAIQVNSKTFPFENIPLDERLADLLTRKDPKKDEEARKLYDLLRIFHPTSLFQNSYFSLPVKSDIRTAGFGDVRKYTFPNGSSMNAVHSGIDFGLITGTPVYACAAGKVVFSGQRVTTGHTVIVEHLPGVYSLYFHLDRIIVDNDITVNQLQQLGTVGNTGLSTAAHLHWEVRVNGIAVDPEAFIRQDGVDMGRLSDVLLYDMNSNRKGGDTP